MVRLQRSTRLALQALRAADGDRPLSPQDAAEVSRPWARRVLEQLGFELHVSGAPPLEEPGLLVSNHSSYLDIPVWLASAACCFMAKHSVARAPLIGPGAAQLGTVFVERSSGHSRQAARTALAQAVGSGRQVVVFPEGTTSHDNACWRPGAFEVAVEAGLWIQPAAICYSQPRRCAYVERPFLAHFWDMLSATPVRVELHRFAPRRIQDVERDLPALHAEVDACYQAQRERA